MGIRESAIKGTDIRKERAVVPEWDNAVVFLNELNGAGRDQWQQKLINDEPYAATLAWVIVRSAYDEKGAKVFTKDDIEQLTANYTLPFLERLAMPVLKLSGLVSGSDKDAEKNSENTQSEDSISD